VARGRSIGQEIARGYEGAVRLAVPGSHSALQLLQGARDEGVEAILVATRRQYEAIYSRFPWLYSRVVILDSWREFATSRVLETLRGMNAVLVPHASLIEYVGAETLVGLELPVLGNRFLLEIEASWERKMGLLRRAGIDTPREYRSPDEATGPVMVKLPGAKGGRGYRVATPETLPQVLEEIREMGYSLEEVTIQELLIGVRLYAHYFASPVMGRVELISMDHRLESNIDGLARLPPSLVEELRSIEPTFTVVANQPLVARESLLARILDYGDRFAAAVEKETGYPMAGPFSLEGVVTDRLEYRVFEFSGRIVAGTKVYTAQPAPYGSLYWGEPMYMGRRVARELRLAWERGMVDKVVT
jgi:5-formaminoimidazole-4-carboxamide-1-(beta)-D-ribofuranosyl 5'-monophosphate synthetase